MNTKRPDTFLKIYEICLAPEARIPNKSGCVRIQEDDSPDSVGIDPKNGFIQVMNASRKDDGYDMTLWIYLSLFAKDKKYSTKTLYLPADSLLKLLRCFDDGILPFKNDMKEEPEEEVVPIEEGKKIFQRMRDAIG